MVRCSRLMAAALLAPACSHVPDGTPGKSANRFDQQIEIDYSVNPPIVFGEVVFDGVPAHGSLTLESCFGPPRITVDDFSRPLDLHWWSPSRGDCCSDGDSQVRIEHGAFVVHGVSNTTVTGTACVGNASGFRSNGRRRFGSAAAARPEESWW